MSIYSGFATRHQQQTYDQLLETVLYVFQRRLIKFYKGQQADQQKFLCILLKLQSQMRSMESHKYLQPKSSNTFQQLINFLKNRQNKSSNKSRVQGILQGQFLETDCNQKKNSTNQNQVNILPVSVTKKQDSRVKASQDLSHKYTERNSQGRQIHKYQQKQVHNFVRPTTAQNQARIMKRISHKSFNQSQNNSKIDGLSFFDNSSNTTKNNKIQEIKNQQSGQKQLKLIEKSFQLSKKPLQHILNPSAGRFAAISKKEARFQFNKSQNSIKTKKSLIKSKQKQKEKQTLQNTQQHFQAKFKDGESDMRDLIKGYINKTKKNYLRAYKKHKNQIDQILKHI